MAYEALDLAIADGVATITFNRPQSFNALNRQMTDELLDAAYTIMQTPEVRCVLMTGAGEKAYCAGGDLSEFAALEPEARKVHVNAMATQLHVAVAKFAWMDPPVIAAVNGVAAGAGISLACCPDLAIAADTARFVSAYSAAGLTPDGSSTWYLHRLIGYRRTMEMQITNRSLSAEEALDWGLVNKVVPAAELMEEAGKLARQIAQGPTCAYGGIKRMALTSFGETLETQLEQESRYIADMMVTADAQEGIAAFLAKRKPVFRGA